MADQPAITTYGERSARAPGELNLFSFLVGKWAGHGKTRLEDGRYAEFQATWIGRYILDGMAIADEFHSRAPDGKPYLGISIRCFDAQQASWIIEYLNVSNSFLRRQVSPRSGSVGLQEDTVVVVSEDGERRIREHYRVVDRSTFLYSTAMSPDAGRSWDTALIEMAMTRVD